MHKWLLALALASTSGVVCANTATDAARQFLTAQVHQPGATVSVTVTPSPAALPACAQPQAFLPGQGQRLLGRVTVGVRCANGQTRYLQARIAAKGRYLVAARTLPAGSILSKDMLTPREGDLAKLPRRAILDPAQAVGRVTTSTLAQGAVIQATQLQAPWLVHRQQQVQVEALGTGFRVTRAGQALQDGALGDTVRVRMPDRSVLVGVVAGSDLVKVNF